MPDKITIPTDTKARSFDAKDLVMGFAALADVAMIANYRGLQFSHAMCGDGSILLWGGPKHGHRHFMHKPEAFYFHVHDPRCIVDSDGATRYVYRKVEYIQYYFAAINPTVRLVRSVGIGVYAGADSHLPDSHVPPKIAEEEMRKKRYSVDMPSFLDDFDAWFNTHLYIRDRLPKFPLPCGEDSLFFVSPGCSASECL